MTWPGPPSHAPDSISLRRMLTAVARPNVVTIAWRWRYESAAGAGSTVGLTELLHASGAPGLIGVLIAAGLLTVLVSCWPPARRLAAARIWCIVTPHRIRTGCAEACVQSRYGRIPVVLLTRAQPFGERVWLWCRAGTSPADLQAARGILIAACWAREMQIMRSPRHAHIAVIDVIRRPEQARRADAVLDPSAVGVGHEAAGQRDPVGCPR